MAQGQIYNGEAIEKSVEDITVELARRGYPFGHVRPRGDRNPETRAITVFFVVDEGVARLYRAHQYPRQLSRHATMSSGANSISAKAIRITAP